MNEGATEVRATLKKKKKVVLKRTEGRPGQGDKFENFKPKITFQRMRRKRVYFSLRALVAVLESQSGGQCEVADRCFSEEGLGPWVCAFLSTLYPLFIESKPG